MADKWYPVIDYIACTECGSCVSMCSRGVYDKEKAPSPIVVKPMACIDHCHLCGSSCPHGAITYVGDDTGWLPPHGKQDDSKSCCECGCGCDCEEPIEETSSEDKTLVIDFLYLDLKVCERCMGTDEVLLAAVNEVGAVLRSAGYTVVLNKIEIENEELANQYEFLSSPTIRIDGRDICLEVKENLCGSCSDIGSYPIDCRVYVCEGKEYEVPPKAMIVNAILKAVYGQEQAKVERGPYTLPENLRNFFDGKNSNSTGLCCGEGSCCG